MLTKTKPTLTSGVIVVRATDRGWLYLLLRAGKFWDFPKGLLEADEDSLEAAIREVEEETTINDLKFSWGHNFKDTEPYKGGSKMARYYLAETVTSNISLPVNPEIGKPEHEEFIWTDLEGALQLVADRVKPAVKWAAKILDEN